jgi:hypothetical protein
MTVAQLKAQLAEANAKLEAAETANEELRNRGDRPRWPAGVWANTDRTKVTQPEFRGAVRVVIPPDLQGGDHWWMDLSVWNYNPKTSPAHYTKNPPALNASLSPCTPEYAEIRETNRIEYLRKRAAGLDAS